MGKGYNTIVKWCVVNHLGW